MGEEEYVKVEIDYERCEATGYCMKILPEVFEVREGRLHLLTETASKEVEEQLREAEDVCPTQAITIMRGGAGTSAASKTTTK